MASEEVPAPASSQRDSQRSANRPATKLKTRPMSRAHLDEVAGCANGPDLVLNIASAFSVPNKKGL